MASFGEIYQHMLQAIERPEVVVSFLFGCLVILLNLRDRFSKVVGEYLSVDINVFSLQDLVSRNKYKKGVFAYFVVLFILYLILSTAGPTVFKLATGKTLDPVAIPLYAALILAGIVPNIKHVDRIELAARRLAQRLAGVPSDHSYTLAKIKASKVSVRKVAQVISDRDLKARIDKNIEEGVFDEDLSKTYVKIKLILFQLSTNDVFAQRVPNVAARFEHLVSAVVSECAKIESKVAKWSSAELKISVSPDGATDPETRELIVSNAKLKNDIKDRIEKLLTDVSHLLSCMIVATTSAKKIEINNLLNDLGLEVNMPVRPDTNDRVLGAIAASACAITILAFLFALIKILFRSEIPVAPDNIIDCLITAISYTVPLFIGLISYLKFRERTMTNSGEDSWYSNSTTYTVKAAMRIKALLLSTANMIVAGAAMFALTVFMGAENPPPMKAIFNPLDEAYWHNILTFIATPLVTLFVFSFALEKDRELDNTKPSSNSSFLAWFVPTTLLFALLAAVVNVGVNFLPASESGSGAVETVQWSVFGWFELFVPSMDFSVWYAMIAAIAVATFFFSFIRSNETLQNG